MHIAQSFTRCRPSCHGSVWCLVGGVGWDMFDGNTLKVSTCEVSNGGAVLRKTNH